MTKPGERRKSRLAGQNPAQVRSVPTEVPRLGNIPEEEGPGEEPGEHPEYEETPERIGRLTIDINRNLRRDLKQWAAGEDATLADVVRAMARLVLADDDTPARDELVAAIHREVAERNEREDARRRRGR